MLTDFNLKNSFFRFVEQEEVKSARLRSPPTRTSVRSQDKLGVYAGPESEPPTIVPTNTNIESDNTRVYDDYSRSRAQNQANVVPQAPTPESSKRASPQESSSGAGLSSISENRASRTAMDSIRTGSQASRINQGSLHTKPFSPNSSDNLGSIADLSVDDDTNSFKYQSLKPAQTQSSKPTRSLNLANRGFNQGSRSNVASSDHSSQSMLNAPQKSSRHPSMISLDPREATDTERSTTLISAFEDEVNPDYRTNSNVGTLESEYFVPQKQEPSQEQEPEQQRPQVQEVPETEEPQKLHGPPQVEEPSPETQTPDRQQSRTASWSAQNTPMTGTERDGSTDDIGASLQKTSETEDRNTPVGARVDNLSTSGETGSTYTTGSTTGSTTSSTTTSHDLFTFP